MGCTQSKIENEEAVARCKSRKLHINQAVSSRNAFAAAHSAYAVALKNTGAALSDYAPGESHHHPSAAAPTQPPMDNILPPPPLPSYASSSSSSSAAPAAVSPPVPPLAPLSRAVSLPEFTTPDKSHHFLPSNTIAEDDNEEADNEGSVGGSLRRRSRRSRSGGRTIKSPPVEDTGVEEEDRPQPPPSPPLQNSAPPRFPPAVAATQTPPISSLEGYSVWNDYFFKPDHVPGSLGDLDEDTRHKEMTEHNLFDEMPKRTEERQAAGQAAAPQRKVEYRAVEKKVELEQPTPPSPQASTATTAVKGLRMGKQQPGMKGGGGGGISVSLEKVFNDLDDCFLRASESAHDVSKLLEANRLHYHSNFADNRGHIDHSDRVMRVITWNRSFRNLPNQNDIMDDLESEEHETHATVLDKLLAWEKKLYDEVKAGELMKFEYQKKVASLNKQKNHDSNSEALQKAKAAVSHLHTRYIVDMQALDSTVQEINRLRDKQLYPKLVALVDGLATMWKTARGEHEEQARIAIALKALDAPKAPKQTSEHHHERTIQLWAVVQEWHSQFEKLVTHQKDYIKELNSWLRLNLVPIESNLKEKVSSPPRPQRPPIQYLLYVWQEYLDKLPDESAKSSINSFAAVVNTIVQLQEDELKLKLRCEDTRRELYRRSRQYDDWCNKHKQRRTSSELAELQDFDLDPEVVDKRVAVEALKNKLEEDEEEYRKQRIYVRDKSLVSLRARLPELFHAMAEYSQACSDMYSNLRSIPQPWNPDGSFSS